MSVVHTVRLGPCNHTAHLYNLLFSFLKQIRESEIYLYLSVYFHTDIYIYTYTSGNIFTIYFSMSV